MSCKSPVLLRIFNRPHTTLQVLKAIRNVKPSKLYIASDGPRKDIIDEESKVLETRSLLNIIDWNCEVLTFFSDTNRGGPRFGFESICWFFENEEEGIILEDDCLPNNDFFYFCDEMLGLYRNHNPISCITGNNFQKDNKNISSYSFYFSKYNHVWGWASWRRAWKFVDLDLNYWPELKNSTRWDDLFRDSQEQRYWEKIFNKQYNKEIFHWDYAWTAANWYQNGLTVTPSVNLVSNIGFGEDALNCKDSHSKLANIPTDNFDFNKSNYPSCISIHHGADRHAFNIVFNGKMLRFPFVLYYQPLRVLKYVIRKFKQISNL